MATHKKKQTKIKKRDYFQNRNTSICENKKKSFFFFGMSKEKLLVTWGHGLGIVHFPRYFTIRTQYRPL